MITKSGHMESKDDLDHAMGFLRCALHRDERKLGKIIGISLIKTKDISDKLTEYQWTATFESK